MRVPRGWSVVLGVAGALVGTLVGAGPAAAAGVGTLRLTPDRGRPTTQFTLAYQYPQQNNACSQVSFRWGQTSLGTARGAHGQRSTSPCLITLTRLMPPTGDSAPGPHTITATFEGQAKPAQAALYTVLPGPTFSATPSRTSATRQPTGDATGDTVAGGVDTSQAAAAPLATGAPSVADAASGGSGGGGLMSWILIFGGLLVLGGITIFGLLIYWTRRGGGPGDHDADTAVLGE